jgi:hypothetical protein
MESLWPACTTEYRPEQSASHLLAVKGDAVGLATCVGRETHDERRSFISHPQALRASWPGPSGVARSATRLLRSGGALSQVAIHVLDHRGGCVTKLAAQGR